MSITVWNNEQRGKAFFDSDLNDTIIKYYPSAAVKTEIKQQGYHLNYKTIDLRLIKYQIGDEKYICATMLIDKRYPLNEFSKIYHGRFIGRHIKKIIMTIEEEKNNWIDRILNGISHIRQKIRPGRHYPKQSRKPYTKMAKQ